MSKNTNRKSVQNTACGKLETVQKWNHSEGVNNVYVRNLDYSINNDRLRQEFSKFGTIISSKVCMENGRSRGMAFVCFATLEQATNAVSEMNGHIIRRRTLEVGLVDRQKATHQQRFARLAEMNRIRARSLTPASRTSMVQNDSTSHRGGRLYPSRNDSNFQRLNRSRTSSPDDRGPRNQTPYRFRNMRTSLLKIGQNETQRPLPVAVFARFPIEVEKHSVTNRLQRRVRRFYDTMGDKVIQTFLELDYNELLHMVEDEETFRVKMQEATAEVLNA